MVPNVIVPLLVFVVLFLVGTMAKALPLPFPGQARGAALAARCVAELGGREAYWRMADALFLNQAKLSAELIERLAGEQGIDPARLGACAADILGRTDYDFVDRELADFFRENDRRAMAKGGPAVNEEWITFASDGHRELVETTKAPVHDPQGRLIGVLGIGHDITERKRSELLLQQSEQRYRNLHESLRDAFARCDLAGRIVECNHAFLDLLGYDESELLGLNFRQITSPRWHESEEGILRDEVMVSGASNVYEKEYVHKDGHLIPIEIRTYLLRDEHEQPVGMWAIIRDISERMAAEAALAALEGQGARKQGKP